MIVTDEAVVLSTVLGSCISVCLYSKQKKAGGMIHFALPNAPLECDPEDFLRYGDRAIPLLIERLARLCQHGPGGFIAKIVGGADNLGKTGFHSQVGEANVAIARKILAEFGIEVAGEKLGGASGRQARFHVKTGRLQVAEIDRA